MLIHEDETKEKIAVEIMTTTSVLFLFVNFIVKRQHIN